jgi:hypothetical protein
VSEEWPEKEVLVGGKAYVCPSPNYLHKEVAAELLEEGEPSHERLSYILAFMERRGFKAGFNEVERFMVKHPKW